MPDQDLPPEFRQHHHIPPAAIPIELPLDDDVMPPPVRKPDSDAPEQRNPEPFLRRS
jgi:hypothetical protein